MLEGSAADPREPLLKPEAEAASYAGLRVLVTGAAGFIGSHLVDRLVELGARVIALDNLETGRDRNLFVSAEKIEFMLADVRDEAALSRAFGDGDPQLAPTIVFHLAALGSVPRSILDPLSTHETNATGTMNLLSAAARAGSRRLVLASSSSIYGDVPDGILRRESQPPAPLSPYAASKVAAEAYARAWSSFSTLETAVLRLFNVYGPRQDPGSKYAAVVPRFLSRCLRGAAPEVYGDGLQQRDFTFVTDVVDAFLRAGVEPNATAGALNIGGGRPVSILRLAEMAIEVCARRGQLTPIHLPPRAGDIRDSAADSSAAAAALGWHARTELESGLKQTAIALAAEQAP